MKKIFSVLAISVVAMIAAKPADAQVDTGTGFVFPLDRVMNPNGSFMNRDRAHGGTYFDGFYHIGEDTPANVGDVVRSIGEGVIMYRSTSGWGTGNCALIALYTDSTGVSFTYLYGHIRNELAVGTRVSRGQRLGEIGPYPGGSHLHLGCHPGAGLPPSASGKGWGMVRNQYWSDANGFVSPLQWIKTHSPGGAVSQLVRAANEPTVWLIQGGRRRAIPSILCFDDWKFQWPNVRVISRSELETFPWEKPVIHLIRVSGTPTVAWVYDGFKRPITSAAIFDAEGFRWDDIREVTAARYNSIPTWKVLDRVEAVLIVKDGPFVTPPSAYSGENLSSGMRVWNIARDHPQVPFRIATSYWGPNQLINARNFPVSPPIYLAPNAEYVWWSSWDRFIQIWERGNYYIKPAMILDGRWSEMANAGTLPFPSYGFSIY
ncbi:MAG: M23 family metallopeptidase [Fimbriimonadaceae bacterium]